MSLYENRDPKQAAGIAFVSPGGEVLFIKRADSGEWAFPGGWLEEGETSEDAAARESEEETGRRPNGDCSLVSRDQGEAVNYATFRHAVDALFIPELNAEHVAHAWARPAHAPEPLHPGVKAILPKLAAPTAHDSIAFDRATVRSYDNDGRLHVETTNISKANICPYFGREIPGYQSLGLDPDKTYKLLRHPDELEKAVPTFNNVPLLSRHVPVSADNHQPDLVIGSTGTDAAFNAPYLTNSLVVWAGDAINAIEADVDKELSASYRYTPDMTPGKHEGESYDGVMRDIVANHVALVREGRAGRDVAVGDSKEEFSMTKTVLSRKAAMTQGALIAYLRPKLAADAKIEVTSILKDITGENFPASKTKIAEDVKSVTTGKLAADADITDLVQLLDALEGEVPAENVDMEPRGLPLSVKTMDGDSELRAFLASKGMSEEDIAQACSLTGEKPAQDEDKEEKKKDDEKKDTDKKFPFEGAKDMITKEAMNSAVETAVKAATDAATKIQREIRDAERAVRPYVGDLAMAHDNADGVYAAALKILGVKVDGVHPSAWPVILSSQRVPGSKPERSTLAHDAAAAKSFAERFPEIARLTR